MKLKTCTSQVSHDSKKNKLKYNIKYEESQEIRRIQKDNKKAFLNFSSIIILLSYFGTDF